jgi:hypothetical protein
MQKTLIEKINFGFNKLRDVNEYLQLRNEILNHWNWAQISRCYGISNN